MPDHPDGDDRRQSCLELARAIARGRAFAPLARISVAVLEQDRPWWAAPTQQLARENIAEQPIDRGSAAGVLLALLRILRRAPTARIALLSTGATVVRELELARHWIQHLEGEDDRFVHIGGSGKLAVTSSTALLQLFHRSQPDLLALFSLRLEANHLFDPVALDLLYPFIPARELERDVLSGQPDLVRRVCALA
jgi:hypothetical protein